MIKVILCDDHALIRRGIRDTLSDAPDIEVVGEAGDYGELRDADARAPRCDVLVLDINLPGRSGLDVLHVLKDEGSPVQGAGASACTRKTSTRSARCAPARSATSTRAATRS